MRRSAVALAVLGAVTTGAYAQSSVTLFGILDLAARNVRNGSAGSVKSLTSGGLNTSRIGFRGVEDLGSGLRAHFHLEAAQNPDTGTTDTAKFFGRRATVGLSNPMGELRLGRDYNPTFWNTYWFDPFGAVGVGTILNFTTAPQGTMGSGATTVLRNDNSIGYFLPRNIGGIYGQAMVAAGEGTPGNKYVGGRLGFAAGPVDVAVAYGSTETAFANDFDQANAGASYDFGVAKVMALYHIAKFGDLKQRTMLVGATASFGQSQVRASYAMHNRSGGSAAAGLSDDDDSKLMAVGYVYNLSKRTALYGTLARIKNDGASRAVVNVSPPAGMRGGESSTGYELGVSHIF